MLAINTGSPIRVTSWLTDDVTIDIQACLVSVDRIVDQHQGNIWFQNQSGCGYLTID